MATNTAAGNALAQCLFPLIRREGMNASALPRVSLLYLKRHL